MLGDVLQALDVRDVAADLDREEKVVRRLLRPARDRLAAWEAIERRVDLDRVEVLRVEAQPRAGREPRRVEDAVPPVGVVPAGAADPQRVSAFASVVHSSGVPAATT